VGYIWLFLNILSFIKNAMVICKTDLQDCTHTDNIYSVYKYVRSKRILHVPSLEKFVQPFKCYQINILSLTCQMIDCTGQCESATACSMVNQTIYCNYYLTACLMPDNFAHQGESGLRLLSATSIEI
jgi:hypothetical protein